MKRYMKLFLSLCINSSLGMDNSHEQAIFTDVDVKQIVAALNQYPYPWDVQWETIMKYHAHAIASRINHDSTIKKEHLIDLKNQLKCPNFDINCLKKIRCNVGLLNKILTHGENIEKQFKQKDYTSLKDVAEDKNIPDSVRLNYTGDHHE